MADPNLGLLGIDETYGDPAKAWLAGTDARITGRDPSAYALAAAQTAPEQHPAYEPVVGTNKPIGSDIISGFKSKAFGSFLDSLYGIDPMFKLNDQALSDAGPAGPQAMKTPGKNLVLIGVGVVLLLLAFVSLTFGDGRGRVILQAAKKGIAAA